MFSVACIQASILEIEHFTKRNILYKFKMQIFKISINNNNNL